LIAQKGVDAAIAIVESYPSETELKRIVNEGEFNSLGYELLAEKRFTEAIGILKLVTFVYPRSANASDSLGDAYAAANQKTDARAAYKRALELVATDPRFDAQAKESFAKDEELKIEHLEP
jgi:Flp pilus assembly protein TadD